MTEIQKLAYESTLKRLYGVFPDNPTPSISQVAKYLKCERYYLTKHRDFMKLTFGDKQRRISLENWALWECRLIGMT